ncbi:MAG: hypothetical protein MUF53_01335 [Gemmatimonadaceae bacterium]|nr:hypothetical protein [Gemmatimonadaceae bacterium]
MTARRARLARYVAWQGLDFLRERGLAVALILAALTVAASSIGGGAPETGFDGAAGKVRLARMTFALATSISLLFLVVGFNGLCSQDRAQGYARFYFAKPVDPAAFYVLKWCVHAIGLLAIVGAWLATLAVVFGPFDAGPTLVGFGLRLVLYGGVLFLLSALVTAEVAVFSGLFLVGEVCKLLAANHDWARPVVTWAFPWQRFGDLDAVLGAGGALPSTAVAHVVGTGLVATLLAVLVLRRRRLVA